MFYALYLIGVLFYLVFGIGYHFANFIDQISMIFIVVPCILVLLCTRTLHAFGRSFLFAFGKKDGSASQYEEGIQSVWLVILAAVISGVLCFLIGIINSCRSQSLKWTSMEGMTWLLLDWSVAMLSLFYSMVLCLVLLPIPFLLKKRLITLHNTVSQSGKDQEIFNADVQPMKCAIVRELLPDYRNGLTSEETNTDIKIHLENCGQCRMIYENMAVSSDTKPEG